MNTYDCVTATLEARETGSSSEAPRDDLGQEALSQRRQALDLARRAYAKAPAIRGPSLETPPRDLEALVKQYAPLVYRIAKKVRRRTGFMVELDDLVCEGTIGLLQAAERFDPARAVDFEHLASVRVHGAMLDSLRRLDPLSQRRRRETRKVRAAEQKLEGLLGRPATAEEVARTLGITVEDYLSLAQDCAACPPTAVEDIANEVGDPRPISDVAVETSQRGLLVREQIEALPERMRLVLSLVYFHELSQKEVANVLEVTEARVSQLHKEALERLRKRLIGSVKPGEDL